MKKVIKQVAGIDVAQKELVVSMGRMYDDFELEIIAYKTFANNIKGFKAFLLWIKRFTDCEIPVRCVMEATGVYHESFAYFLDDEGQMVTIVLPNKISNYFRTLEIKTITDKTASEAIARFGLERKLEDWKRPKPLFKQLRQLTRERGQIIEMRTVTKNQLHAEQSEAEPNKSTLSRMKKKISFFDKEEKEILVEIRSLIQEASPEIQESIKLICTVPGVGLLTAVTVLAETNEFELIRNKRQLTSYAGLDIKEKQSGTSVKGKPSISKRGNKNLRKALHLPALSAIRHNERFKALFVRLVSKHGIKMKAAVAAQRKLLELIYTIYKTQTAFDPNYFQNQQPKLATENI